MSPKRERVEWVDVSKGAGMLAVIAGHTFALSSVMPLYAFHMPLFFLLAGMVFRPERYDGWDSLAASKAKALFVPYALACAVSAAVCLMVPQWAQGMTVEAFAADFYSANTNVIQNSSLWFIPALFVAFLVVYAVRRVTFRSSWMLVVLALVAYALTFQKVALSWGSDLLPEGRLPFKADSALVGAVFLGVGCYCAPLIRREVERTWPPMVDVALVVLSAVACMAVGWVSLNSLDFGNWAHLAFYPTAFMACFAFMRLSKHALRVTWLASALKWYGRHSLVIFMAQSLLIRLYLLLFNDLQGLDMTLYADNPFEHQVGSFVAVAFVAAPLVAWIASAMSRKVKSRN